MNSTVGLLIFVLLWAVGLVWFFYGVFQNRLVFKQLAELSAQKGWQFEKSQSSFVDCILRGQEADIHWEMKYINREQTFGRQRTASIVWSTAEAKSQAGSVVIYPKLAKLPGPANIGGVGQLLLDGMLQMMGVNAAGLTPQPVGSAVFQDKYTVLAADAVVAEGLVVKIETLLLNWPPTSSSLSRPSIKADANGVQVRVNRTGTPTGYQCQVAEHIVPLGIATVNAFR